MRFFFYGTLRPDAGTLMARWIADRLIRADAGRAPGRLHAVPDPAGWYPALLPGPGRVFGVLCDLRLRTGEQALLDRYEGREYRRTALPVRTATGRGTAHVYVWRGNLPEAACLVGGGDFPGWLGRTGRRAYGCRGRAAGASTGSA